MIKLISNYTNGDLSIVNGKIEFDYSLETAVFLSLFGGNKKADTKEKRNPSGTENEDWFGNMYLKETGTVLFNSTFERTIIENAVVSGNLIVFEKAAVNDLNWFIQRKIADEVKAEVSIVDKDTIKITVRILKNKKTLGKYTYLFNSGVSNV